MGALFACVLLVSPAGGEAEAKEPEAAQVLVKPERVVVVPVGAQEGEPEGLDAPQVPQLEIELGETKFDDVELSPLSYPKTFSDWDALPSINLGLGMAWHPGNERKVGFNGELLFGATLWDIPLSLWPEIGVNVGTAKGRGQVTGVAQLGVGLASLLYYHVGFEGGLTVDGIAYGPRHGPSLRCFQFFGLELRHKVFFAHEEAGAPRHDLTLNFSIDFGAMIGLATGNWSLW